MTKTGCLFKKKPPKYGGWRKKWIINRDFQVYIRYFGKKGSNSVGAYSDALTKYIDKIPALSQLCFGIEYLAKIMLKISLFFSRLVWLPFCWYWSTCTHQLTCSHNILVRQKRKKSAVSGTCWSLCQEVCGEVSLAHSFLSPKPGSQGLRSLIHEADIQQMNWLGKRLSPISWDLSSLASETGLWCDLEKSY